MENYLLRHKDGGYMYRSGTKWSRTTDLNKADRMTREKALNILCKCIGMAIRDRVEVVPEREIVCAALSQTEFCGEGPECFDWESLSQTQCDLYRRLVRYGEYLRKQLSNVDLEICDIEHYIEFFTLDAAKGYKAYRMLKGRLEQRRNIKDEMARVNCFLSGGSQDFSSGKVADQIHGLDDRCYIPRVLSELFDLDAAGGKLRHVS